MEETKVLTSLHPPLDETASPGCFCLLLHVAVQLQGKIINIPDIKCISLFQYLRSVLAVLHQNKYIFLYFVQFKTRTAAQYNSTIVA